MAGRTSFIKAHFSVKNLLFIPIDISIGSTGAPTLVSGKSDYAKTITRNSTGNYTITLGDGSSPTPEVYKYNRLAFMDANVLYSNSGAPSAIISVQPISDTLSTAGQVNFICSSATATAADPESGSTLKLLLIVKLN